MIDARVVIDAARDPTRDDDPFLKIQPPAPPPPPPRSVSFAIAGARGVGKTAFVRRFFSESRRTVVGHTDDDDDRSLSSSWRSTPTIGMDYGAVTLASPMTTTPRVRFRFYDPSGAVAHAACRAEAFRAAKAIVVVVDPDARRVDDDNDDEDDDDRAIEGMIDEIVRAREGASDDDEDARVGGVWVAFARMRRSRHGDDDGDVVDGRIEREKSSDARLDRVIRAVIDARRRRQRRTIGGGDSDDVRFVVDDHFDDDDKDEENHHHPTTTTPPTPKPRGNNNNNNNSSYSSFFTIDASTGLGVRRVVLALVRAIHPSSAYIGIRAGPHHIV